MKKNKVLYIFFSVLILFTATCPNYSNANTYQTTSNSSYEYVITNYNINMVVNENNTFNITETITTNFNVAKHGIYRKIPLRNYITRLDGSKSQNRATISDIRVSENYTVATENNYKVIKIGNANSTITGPHTYKISYTYNIGKDPLKNEDELYFNLIGTEWDAPINKVSFSIEMPKKFDKSLLGFSSGAVGSTNSSNITYSVNGNIITGITNRKLYPKEALTVRLTLPEGYFSKPKVEVDTISTGIILIGISFVITVYKFWGRYGKDEQVVETVEFYPPEGYNSAEIDFLYNGNASNEGVISLLVYLANKGYIKIEDGKNSSSENFRIVKLKEYDGDNDIERLFFEGLFEKCTGTTVNIEKAKEIMREASLYGEKISFKDALEMSVETGGTRDTITTIDLYNKFYITLDKIKEILNSKENKEKIFEKSSLKKDKVINIMVILLFLIITIKPILEVNGIVGIAMLPFAIIFPGIALWVISTLVLGGGKLYSNGKEVKSILAVKIFALVWGGMFGGMPWFFIVYPCLTEKPINFVTYIIGVVCILVISFFKSIMPKRTKFGNEILGKLKGFKRFLETAEKDELESLVMKNPEYFYNILPYTYALGVSDIWINQFECIALEAPKWYDSDNDFNIVSFGTFMNTTMEHTTSAMSSSPSSSSGGGSSGGGSSGGGSGGGGGGSW